MQVVKSTKEVLFDLALKNHNKIQKMLAEGYLPYRHSHTAIDGTETYITVRYKNHTTKDKWIRKLHWDGEKWVWKKPDFPDGELPYMVHELVKHPDATAFVLEGEQKVDVLNEFLKKSGIYGKSVAITTGSSNSAGGANLECMKGHDCIIWEDNDKQGRKYAREMSELLEALGCQVTWVDVEKLNLPWAGSDAVDFLNAHPNDAEKHFSMLLENVIEPIMEDPADPLFDIEEARVGKFMAAPPPPQRWVLSACLPLGKTVLIVGPGGVGKSRFIMQLQIALATGLPFCGCWPVGEEGASLALYSEDEETELHRRFHNIVHSMKPNQQKLIAERVHFKSMVGMSNQLTHKDGAEVEWTDYVDRLIALARQIKNLKLIIIDPASRFRGGDENNSTDTTRFVEACEMVAKATGATVMIVHHVNKGSMRETDSSQAASRGSSALTDGVRWQMNLSPMSEAEAKTYDVPKDQRRLNIKALVTKNNYGPPQAEDVWLKLSESGVLARVEMSTALDTKNEERLAKIVKKVTDDAAIGIEHSKSGFGKEYAGKDGIFEIGDQGLRGLIELAIEKKLLQLVPPSTPKANVSLVLAPVIGLKKPEENIVFECEL